MIRVNDMIVFDDWYYDDKHYFWCRPLLRPNGTIKYDINGIYIDMDRGFLAVSMCGAKLSKLRDLLGETVFCNENNFDIKRVEEIKQTIDNFLLQMAKLGAFA